MRSRNFLLKTLTIFLALNILSQVLAPTLSMALTSGPTTPEVSSFEPVDTTDMVDLATGDFNYNIPLLDIPGPEGGYPIALSYHGGILPAQDASWVGLGWNINPGAINRTVNNFADDYNDAIYTINDTWVGGVTTEYTVGVGLGIANTPLSVGVSVGVKQDTYKGSTGVYGFSIGITEGPISFGVSYQEDDWNNSTIAASVGVGDKNGLGLSLTAGETNGKGFAGVNASSSLTQSSMGVSLSGGKMTAYAQPVGAFVGRNDNYGKISTESGGFSLAVPIYCFYLSVGYKYNRYWSDTRQSTYLYGVLHSKDATDNTGWGGNSDVDMLRTFDCTILMDPNKNMADQGNLNWTPNPSIPTYDSYAVLGQGISGAIEPVLLDNGSLFERRYDHDGNGFDMMYWFHRRFTKPKHFFRFLGDLSNSHELSPTNFEFASGGSGFTYPTTDLAYTVKNVDPRGYKKTLDANSKVTEARFAGSRHVEYYTNAEIIAGTAKAAGFMNSPNVSAADRGNAKTFNTGAATNS